ncbi:hypothetical protein [Citrobacter freundii]|uniref:hypothetical protein n=1 Tax=Citrobacter freundii TaxID=546 RepID=UPI00387A64E7
MLINNETEQNFSRIIVDYETIIENLHKENSALLEANKLKTRIIAKQNLRIKFYAEMTK